MPEWPQKHLMTQQMCKRHSGRVSPTSASPTCGTPADFIHDLSPEAREFLRKADKWKIEQLESHISFMNAAGIVWKFLWVGAATLFAMFIGLNQIWDWFAKHFKITGIK